MSTRMLIDARHPEETRVAVLKGNRIEEFDFESDEHRQIKGNIYLAKVTRVEPSLQAAFVDFGGNRHGFLAFSEIHPDYYQIPAADRAALLAEEQAAADEEAALRAEEDEEEDDDDRSGGDGFEDDYADGFDGVEEIDTSDKDHVATIEDGHVENGADGEPGDAGEEDAGDHEDGEERGEEEDGESRPQRGRGRGRRQGSSQGGGRGGNAQRGGSRAKEMDEVRSRRQALRRRYKIQDVIQRRQVLLVQVVKEERGNKGAALTSYLSLAGRYCVLMPNSSNGGGISRKISSGADRKRLKSIVSELTLPRSMGLIVRTAGLQRTKPEIKRDFDYLARLWDEIRERTLGSSAPAVIHSDSDLIKRAIRDIYNSEVEEVIVEGEAGFKAAKAFMKLLMPSHARRVQQYADPVPLFQRFGAEDQLAAMYDPEVQLKSGGYIVINPTEALVSIDINSGRSTREHSIEQTATATNLEAAREIARQLRLRDMAGLVVIDFIDMENNSNIRKVERAMKDALKNDRARIQVGRISSFGLMEMSRQRLRTGVLEASTRSCPHCDGTGLVRTASSAGLAALRLIEEEAAKGKGTIITLFASTEATIYLLNAKRADQVEIEERYGVNVEVRPEGEDEGAKMRVTSAGPRPTHTPRFEPIADVADLDDDIEEDEDEAFEEEEAEAEESPRRAAEPRGDDDGEGRGKKRRRRRGGKGRSRDRDDRVEGEGGEERAAEDEHVAADAEVNVQEGAPAAGEGTDEDDDRPRRRRRRRGGRGRNRDRDDRPEGEAAEAADGEEAPAEIAETAEPAAEAPALEAPEVEASEADSKPKRRSRARKVVEAEPEGEAVVEAEAPVEPEVSAANAADEAPKPKRRSRAKKADVDSAPEPVVDVPAEAAPDAETPEAAAEVAAKPKRRTRAKKADAEAETVADAAEPAPQDAAPAQPVAAEPAGETPTSDTAAEGDAARRGGWWQRTFGA